MTLASISLVSARCTNAAHPPPLFCGFAVASYTRRNIFPRHGATGLKHKPSTASYLPPRVPRYLAAYATTARTCACTSPQRCSLSEHGQVSICVRTTRSHFCANQATTSCAVVGVVFLCGNIFATRGETNAAPRRAHAAKAGATLLQANICHGHGHGRRGHTRPVLCSASPRATYTVYAGRFNHSTLRLLSPISTTPTHTTGIVRHPPTCLFIWVVQFVNGNLLPLI